MATNLNNTTFLSEYNDDYRDSDHYHRVLFNNGKALQARELTQSQTIIQKELETTMALCGHTQVSDLSRENLLIPKSFEGDWV